MKKTSMTLLSLFALSGVAFGQTAAMLVDPVASAPEGSYRFKQDGRISDYTLCSFEVCRLDKSGVPVVRPYVAGSPSLMVAHASDKDADNYLVFYPAGKEGIPEARRILRKRYLVTLRDGADLAAIKNRCGIKNIELVHEGSNLAICEEESAGRVLSQISDVLADPDIESAEPLLARQRTAKLVPTDPFYAANNERLDGQYQWYLNNTGENGGVPDVDINVEAAFDRATGVGVTIAIVDDGLATDHEDLAANATGPHFNVYGNTALEAADPTTFDIGLNHGTNVAGLAAADHNNGRGISGAAPAATLSGVRLLGGLIDDFDEARALGFRTDVVDVSNNSWGPDDTTLALESPGNLTLTALRNGAENGRGGLGVVYVWSGGNGGLINDNSNYDGYANSIYTIAVGALNDAGRKAGYSERGANLIVSAPSSGGAQQVLTTQFGLGLDLDDNIIRTSEYTPNFSGTSAAVPLVSGVVALMLEENPNLSWRDVQDILIRTATKVDDNGGWVTNAAGLEFNHNYGAGLVNAEAAVTEAADRAAPGGALFGPAVRQLKSIFFQEDADGINQLTGIVPDGTGASYQVAFDFSDEPNVNVEHVQVALTIITERRSDLEIVLISPNGTQSILQEVDLNNDEQSISSWAFMTVRNWGEDSAGTWVLRVTDRVTGVPALINNANLIIHGALDPAGSVTQIPLLVSNQSMVLDQGQPFTYVLETIGATGVSVGDLPGGITYDPSTSTISGIPTQPGVFTVPLSLTSGEGATATPSLSIVVRPTSVALGSAIGLPNYPAIAGGSVSWDFEFVDTNDVNVPADQRRSVRSGENLDDSSESIFGFNGLPQGVMLFDWKTSSEEGADRLYFNLGGDVPQFWSAFISGERDWGRIAVPLPNLSNNVRWIYSKNPGEGLATDSVGEDRGLVDNVELVEMSKYMADLELAVGLEGFDLEMDSRALWMPIAFPPNPNNPTAPPNTIRTSTVGNGQTVSLAGWLDGPGTLSFRALNFADVSDVLEFLIDGVVIESRPGAGVGNAPVDPILANEPIREGRHRMQIRFRKDFRGSAGREVLNRVFDGVTLNNLKFVPTNNFNTFASSFGPDSLLPEADADGDGFTNFEEYAFGGNVLVSDLPKFAPKVVTNGSSNLIEFGVDKTRTDLEFVPQQSADLENWADAQFVRLDRVEGNVEYYQIPVINVVGREALYYRVQAVTK